MQKKFASDESGITVTVETIILFSISIILMLMILQTFQGLNQKQTKIVLEEQFMSIGNSIAKKITEMNLAANSGLATGSITSEIWIPAKIVDHTYTVQLSKSKVILISNDPDVTVEVPISSDIKIAQNGTIISTDYKYTLKYDSETCSISFLNSGAVLIPDTSDPSISIYSPTDGAIINKITKIIVNVSDDVSVKKVEYYVDGELKYTAINPYNWDWDTRTTTNFGHNVTAVAYDCMGNKKPVTRNYTVSNSISSPPVISNPSPNTTIYFKKPIIQATISDDIRIDFASIILKVDGDDRTVNITYANISQKLTTISYMPSNNMINGSHDIYISVKDFDLQETSMSWSFNIEDLPDDYDPTVTIEYPKNTTTLNPGEFITVSYTANDLDNSSGLDNLTINVTRINDGVFYLYYKNISTYPTIRKTINPMETWTSTEKYAAGMSYKYNITIFDRSGKMGFASLLNRTVGPGQAGQLNVDTSVIQLTNGNTRIENIRVRDISSSNPVVKIDYIIVSWVTNSSSEKINRVRFDGNNKWSSSGSYSPSGTQLSGTQLTLSPSYTVPTSNKLMELRFTGDISNRYFTIVFLLSDSSTKTVTFDTY